MKSSDGFVTVGMTETEYRAKERALLQMIVGAMVALGHGNIVSELETKIFGAPISGKSTLPKMSGSGSDT